MLEVFTPFSSQAASTRVRVMEWLARSGISASINSYAGLGNNRPTTLLKHPVAAARAEVSLLRAARTRHPWLLLQKELGPFSSGRLERPLLRNADFSVYDFDDAMQFSLGPRWKSQFHVKSNLAGVTGASRVIAGSENLAEWAARHNGDVHLIPTCIEPGDYRAKTDYAVGATPRLVWIGSPDTERYLVGIAEPLLRVHRLTGARLTVISGGEPSLGPLDQMVDRVQWQPAIGEQLGTYDVGIAPLLDSPWERGKCAYKSLQYAAAGLPAVVSPVGANAKVAGEFGYLSATTAAAWEAALVDLLQASVADRAATGAGARQAVTDLYSYDAWLSRWRAAVTPS